MLESKRLFDLIVVMASILVLFPLFLISVILITLGFHGHIIYSQERVGLNGKIFRLYKLRSMVNDADQIGTTVTTSKDTRITRIGMLLRKTKLDELPQLWNILKGDMSIVGPRPDVPGFADKLSGDDRVILSVRPGITGPATLKYRNEEELLAEQENPEKYNREIIFPDKVRLNKEYVENQCFWKNLWYIWKTILG